MPLLKTRLYKPVLKVHYITRKKILDFLDLHADNSLTLVVAPAGYGKSVTISQWLDHKGTKYGWVSLDEDCNELRLFLDYVVTSFQLTNQNSLTNIQDLCQALDLPSVKVISNLLINEITELDEAFILVLDDYHLISNPQIHQLINEILKSHPEKLKLVVLARRDPPLILNSLRAYEQVSEIRMQELGFDVNELVTLSNNVLTKPINSEEASNLVKVTEGWIIGLRLAIHSIEQGHDLKLVLSNIGNEKMATSMFLVDEILQPLPLPTREYLYKTSILSRFCKDLVLDICTTEDSDGNPANDTGQATFAEIVNTNLFIMSLDSEQIWYRYHHLFAEILQKQLQKRYSSDQISELHRKAGRWFEQNGYYNEALKHAINAGDFDFVNQIIENKFRELFDHERWATLNIWIKMLPAEVIDNYLAPNLILAFLSDMSQDHLNMEKSLEKAHKILTTLSPETPRNKIRWGFYYSLQSTLFYKTGRLQESLVASTRSLEYLENENSMLRDNALLYHVFALLATGKSVEANEKAMHYRALVPLSDQLALARNSMTVSYISFLPGDLQQIYSVLHPLVDFLKKETTKTSPILLSYYLTYVSYQWNNIDEAVNMFDDIWVHRFSNMARWILHHVYMKALTLRAKGEKGAMNDLLAKTHQYVDELGLPYLDKLLACMEVEIALLENDLGRAEQYHNKADYYHYMPYFYYFAPQLTSIKLKIKEGGTENFVKAQAELSEITSYLQSTHNKNLLIQALTLQAILHKLRGNIEGALASMSEAINLGKKGGFIRVFVDFGKEIRELIILLQNSNTDDSYLHKILEAFALEKSLTSYKSQNWNSLSKATSSLNAENFSTKEIEILRLASEGFLNKEIADKMCYSLGSIKTYLYQIYQKLDAKNRANAISKAKELGLISARRSGSEGKH